MTKVISAVEGFEFSSDHVLNDVSHACARDSRPKLSLKDLEPEESESRAVHIFFRIYHSPAMAAQWIRTAVSRRVAREIIQGIVVVHNHSVRLCTSFQLRARLELLANRTS